MARSRARGVADRGLAVALGATNTSVYVPGRGILLAELGLVSLTPPSRHVRAVGSAPGAWSSARPGRREWFGRVGLAAKSSRHSLAVGGDEFDEPIASPAGARARREGLVFARPSILDGTS